MNEDARHVAEHFTVSGLCQCSCDECTLPLGGFCICLDCACDPDDPEAPEHERDAGEMEWVTVPGLELPSGAPFAEPGHP